MKKTVLISLVFSLVLYTLCACSTNSEKDNETDMTIDKNCIVGSDYDLLQASKPKKGDTIVTFETTKGIVRAVLYADKAPKAVENFVTLAKQGYYNGVKFHRVIPNFMVQSGDPTGTGSGGESMWGGKFETELPEGLYHFRGALAMARQMTMNTNGSQFYIVQNPKLDVSSISATGTVRQAYLDFGGYPSLDKQYTVFGQVFQGLDVVDAIAAKGSSNGTPSETIVINEIKITEYEG
ncbi:MAG: peptidylprolyl isomerase [Clostridiales bacterium]|nr:MAG: peptidylprolyl isomerase [Clostridiales bacterium]